MSYKKAGDLLNAGRKQEAFKQIQKLAHAGYVMAKTNLGIMYEAGIGIKKNPHKAVKWHREAAGHGVAESQHRLGTFYAEGLTGKKDPALGAEWYRKAAAQGDVRAKNRLIQLKEFGLDVNL